MEFKLIKLDELTFIYDDDQDLKNILFIIIIRESM